MKQIIFSVIFIISVVVFSASAQTPVILQTFENGVKAANKGEFETALARFQTALMLAGNEETDNIFRAKVHFNIGVCLYHLREQSKAAAEFERAILLNPNHEKTFYALGMTQFELKNWREAEKAFLGALSLNGRNGETWFDLAFVYLAQDDFTSAKKAFEKSVRFKSVSSAVGHNNLGVIFALGGDYDAAIKEFEKALDKSNGELLIAERNLRVCKNYKRNLGEYLTVKPEFSMKS